MRKSLWLITEILLFSALGSTPAHADGVVVLNGGGDVTAIDSITLNGSLYNVTFTSTIDNTFNAYAYDDPTLLAIVTAIDTSLMRKSLNDPTGIAYGVATAGSRALVAVGGGEGVGALPWVVSGITPIELFEWQGLVDATPQRDFWANFTPAVVATPEPATGPLTLTGLGVIAVLMWKRRQDALRQPQAT